MKTYYEIMGVPYDTSSKILKSRYNQLIYTPGISEETKNLYNKAYFTLKNPIRRHNYDATIGCHRRHGKLCSLSNPVYVDSFYTLDRIVTDIRDIYLNHSIKS